VFVVGGRYLPFASTHPINTTPASAAPPHTTPPQPTIASARDGNVLTLLPTHLYRHFNEQRTLSGKRERRRGTLIANSNGIGCVTGITPPSLLLRVLQGDVWHPCSKRTGPGERERLAVLEPPSRWLGAPWLRLLPARWLVAGGAALAWGNGDTCMRRGSGGWLMKLGGSWVGKSC
jgi:hypothetical protein